MLASGNAGKLREFGRLLESLALTLQFQSDFQVPEVAEDGLSFVENAIIKARAAAKHTGLPALADDSGIEVDYLKGMMKLYEVVPRVDARKSGRGRLIKGRWLDVNKGDSANSDVRSRYVGKEFDTGVRESLYAGTPPLEALKLIMVE